MYLFNIFLLRYETAEDFPLGLRQLLEDQRVAKVGVGVTADAIHLKKDFNINTLNCVNLGLFCQQRGYDVHGNASLRQLCRTVLSRELPKGAGSGRHGPWRCDVKRYLREYAARDALASLRIYERAASRNEVIGTTFTRRIPSPSSSHASTSPAADKPSTRVKLDVFHAMKRITDKVPKSHVFMFAFTLQLRDAIYAVNDEDKRAVQKYLDTVGERFDDRYASSSDWILQRVRRVVRPKESLREKLSKLIATYDSDEFLDPITNKRLITPECLKEFGNLLKHVDDDCLSDPPGIPLYYAVGRDKNDLTLYRCVRGTSDTESFHQLLSRTVQCWNGGPELIECIVMIIRHRYNVRASERHRLGFPKIGHYDHFLLDYVSDLTTKIFGRPKEPWWPRSVCDPNGIERAEA